MTSCTKNFYPIEWARLSPTSVVLLTCPKGYWLSTMWLIMWGERSDEFLYIVFCLSVLFAMIFFFALYILCCMAAMKGKFDIVLNKKFCKSPDRNLKFVSPFKNFKRKSEGKIPLYRHVNSEENQTDTDTCWKLILKIKKKNGWFLRQEAA